jgi:high affinity sulfate transporter 1
MVREAHALREAGRAWAPGLAALARLRLAEAPREMAAGLGVAAVAIPVGLAYAALLGVPPVIGLYASLLPMAAYALAGPSPFLIVGPDTATCLLVASAVTALGLHDPAQRATAAAALALIAGAGFAIAALLKLGFVANLLSRPILVGYLAGVALTLLVAQIGAFTGVSLQSSGLLRPILEIVRRAGEIHGPTLALATGLFLALRAMTTAAPRLPGPAVVLAAAITLSWALDLPGRGVAVIGAIPGGLPRLELPTFDVHLPDLGLSALGLLLVSFSSGILTARSFGQELGEHEDANLELRGFAAANIAAGLFQGFPVTGADSRTAIGLAAGGRTPLVAIAAAITLAVVLSFLTAPLSLLPQAALGAVLASAALGLIDPKAFARLWRIDRYEFAFAVVAMGGVIWLGVLQGVFLAIAVTLLHLIRLAMWPRCTTLGLTASSELVSQLRDPTAVTPKGGVIFVFEASLLFVNADYFLERALAALDAAPGARWFVLDAGAMPHGDTTGLTAAFNLKRALEARGIRLAVAAAQGRFLDVARRAGLVEALGAGAFYATPAAALADLGSR